MSSNLDRFKTDLKTLVDKGDNLLNAIQAECFPEAIEEKLRNTLGEGERKTVKDWLQALPSFDETYQVWYSEAKVLVKQLLPDRFSDFVSHYEKPKGRKSITFENYKIEDYLQGLRVTRYGDEKIVGPDAAIPQYRQQLAILKSVQARFESSLFDIRQLAQADLFDSELDAAKELAKNKFARAAGAVAGAVLERHLGQVSENHSVRIAKKTPTISDLNDALKQASIIETATWRFIQHLADLRNLCDHDKKKEPTVEQANDLVDGVMKMTKTLF
jgi:hypothetical protein